MNEVRIYIFNKFQYFMTCDINILHIILFAMFIVYFIIYHKKTATKHKL